MSNGIPPWELDPRIIHPNFWPEHFTTDWVSWWYDFVPTRNGIIWLYYESWMHDLGYFLGYKVPVDIEPELLATLKPWYKPSLEERGITEFCENGERNSQEKYVIDLQFKNLMKDSAVPWFNRAIRYRAVRILGGPAYYG